MKVLLIKAERLSETDRWVANPLGIMYLSSVARLHGHQVSILDLRVLERDEVRQRLDSLLAEKPQVVGLSALSHQARNVRKVANYIKEKLPDAFMVAGGPLATANTEYVLSQLPVNVCVLGEGEQTLLELLSRLDGGLDWRDITGIAWRKDGEIKVNPPTPFIEKLDELPYPAWDQIDFDRYAKFISMSLRLGKRASIHTSRGCPYQCIFCHSFFGKKFRARSPENVLGEIELLYNKYNIRRLEIIDDIFNLDRKRAVEILEGIRDNFPKLEISFPSGLRGDIMDEEFIKLLKQARCYYMAIGIETASSRLQMEIKKNVDINKIKIVAKSLAKYRVPAYGFFAIGFPSESREEMEATFKLAKELSTFIIPGFSIITPYPKTELWEQIGLSARGLNPDNVDGLYGYYLNSEYVVRLMERALKLTRKNLLSPKNWSLIFNELVWRIKNDWQIFILKLIVLFVPIKFKRKIIEMMNTRLEQWLE